MTRRARCESARRGRVVAIAGRKGRAHAPARAGGPQRVRLWCSRRRQHGPGHGRPEMLREVDRAAGVPVRGIGLVIGGRLPFYVEEVDELLRHFKIG